MRYASVIASVAAVAYLSSCASSGAGSAAEPAICEALDLWVHSAPRGEDSELSFGRSGRWLVDHVKWCNADEDRGVPDRVCAILLNETSTEFFDVNFVRALNCYDLELDMRQSAGSIGLYSADAGIDLGEEGYLTVELNPQDGPEHAVAMIRFRLVRD